MKNLTDQIYDKLRTVIDPELNINVVDLGLIYEIEITKLNDVYIQMTLTTPGCPLHDSITSGVEAAVVSLDGVNRVEVDLVWDPPWSPDKMSQEALKKLQT
ncbi:metal-sulfur cluster assembly factor [Chengkuizengella axinellae]|uniref:Iron-sulfur cluster assembly protein n=1 Tax=Chengkuizengella axinellae TaxID=3064388 RepID=A0ABT9IUJ0_9BACL|nr:iron-sulfur cluster assembly protein [Chengkuizengella sp. 2205SS18-9]MDP5273019.1 iron-sulfur cluster assembly protein [Chengkuizengella sp. 2205SS18-9]